MSYDRALTLLRPNPPLSLCWLAGAALTLICWSARPASAQVYEEVGIRAQGMGGAFVAVANDATATWWNPAGLGGAYFSAVLELGASQDPSQPTETSVPATPSWRGGARGFAVSYPALGLSYYRLRASQIRPSDPTAATSPGRQDQGRAPVLVTTLELQQFGATIGQSIGDHLIVGSTLKLVRGRLAGPGAASGNASMDAASDLDDGAETHTDIDMGAMLALGQVRLGAVVKNLRQPGFASGVDRLHLRRQARIGVAASAAGAAAPTIALDVDLTRTATAWGEARHVAAGFEAWVIPRRLSVRGGLSANTSRGAQLAASSGISVAMRSRLYLDGQATLGSDRTRNGWGVGARVTF